MKLKLKYYLGNINVQPPQVRTQFVEAEVDNSFLLLSDEEKQAALTKAGMSLLRSGEEVGGVEVTESLKL